MKQTWIKILCNVQLPFAQRNFASVFSKFSQLEKKLDIYVGDKESFTHTMRQRDISQYTTSVSFVPALRLSSFCRNLADLLSCEGVITAVASEMKDLKAKALIC